MSSAATQIAEPNKQRGVRYAWGPDGIEYPVVDVTHPAFALSVSDAEQRALIATFMKEQQPLTKLPALLRRLLLALVLRGSRLAEGVKRSEGSFMTAMDTYLLKLGPDNLPSVFRKPIDRRIAAALPSLAMRLRLQDIARLSCDALLPGLLARADVPLHLLNIGGGPAIDSLNALLLLEREQPGLLRNRSTVVRVLDLDPSGPTFGARALRAMQDEGAALHGLAIELLQVPYDWTKPETLDAPLAAARAANALCMASSEGGLFEYGSDDAILRNLETLRHGAPAGISMVGSVTRADAPTQQLYLSSRAATKPRGLNRFRTLAATAGWELKKVIERPFSDHVWLQPSAAN
ncbi:MAG TPA: hypothetical protein VGI70_00670 [Polyangiales bacterium]